ncbi:hypothetical protein Enr10x_60620 [Gimesia panareensis]|uniref:Uncharacterized protein n=1 Tax=Gimesia panareensis TaxID=2527978 RepID=A0A517QGE2_9PLAN|nr:hypothetical protein [Gimesia panareensis]QDT30694.1 hypothetical protein Enr10x_60620 [Gimesia panareensis]
MLSESDKARWEKMRSLLNRVRYPVLTEWNSMEDQAAAIRYGLQTEKFTAYEFLLLSSDDELKKSILETLVRSASTAHSSIYKNRAVIKLMPRRWVIKHIEPIVNQILTDETDPYLKTEPDEYYRRFAELYDELDDGLLERLLDRAAQHDDPDVKEVAEDFRER